ncbi:GNAT superfamily N-acetyltransferase [Sphingomonas vulcanisoli]|uniref:GNAT superfamily N-acetyltransferase n=1 Tax=Sphingomonas vulcanisoli TaxID=1658060 RepID=A0ABX0TX49_9SPHN|nr:GNAT family N-acetyltransferase [Sphingomonas vulcanisoli]NIJ08734.1 GNAT superfamily N-acetyltransferase [Sphingomonas vulcanisoli]
MPFAAEKVYFMRRARESHAAMIASKDSGARLAHAQLETAYDGLAEVADRNLRERASASESVRAMAMLPSGLVQDMLVGDPVTRGGVALHIRPATPEDAALLAGLFEHVTPEDLRSRFVGTLHPIGAAELAPLMDYDPDTSITFLAFEPTGIAVAASTLADASDASSAEVALSVHAEWKNLGIAWTLMEHTLAYATAHGLREVTSIESGDEQAAVNLEREMGFVARLTSASPIEFSLSKLVSG